MCEQCERLIKENSDLKERNNELAHMYADLREDNARQIQELLDQIEKLIYR